MVCLQLRDDCVCPGCHKRGFRTLLKPRRNPAVLSCQDETRRNRRKLHISDVLEKRCAQNLGTTECWLIGIVKGCLFKRIRFRRLSVPKKFMVESFGPENTEKQKTCSHDILAAMKLEGSFFVSLNEYGPSSTDGIQHQPW